MRSNFIILAYHGCDKEVGERLLSGEEHVRVSDNPYDWLGRGAYFWENNPKRALIWANFIKNHPQNFNHKVKTPFVVGAIIDLGNCLDLTDATSLKFVREAYETYKRFRDACADFDPENSTFPQNQSSHDQDANLTKRYLDCAVINFLHETRDREKLLPFDTVRGVFPEEPPLYPGAKIMSQTHIQISVINPAASIIGYFKPHRQD